MQVSQMYVCTLFGDEAQLQLIKTRLSFIAKNLIRNANFHLHLFNPNNDTLSFSLSKKAHQT
jgi:primosomal protein N''